MLASRKTQPAHLSPLTTEPQQALTHALQQIADSLRVIAANTQSETSAAEQTSDIFQAQQEAERQLEASPIAAFLKDDAVTDILINNESEIYINRSASLEKAEVTFSDAQSLLQLAEIIAASVGRKLDPKRPLVDARLMDGSRVNIIAPPMAVNGIAVSIRKFPKREITLDSLVSGNLMSRQVAGFLRLCAECRVSLMVSGGTGTGKTTMLNAISQFIPSNERIITIEDTAELRLQQPHVVKLETKIPDIYGQRRTEVNATDLVRNALRMRPDRIIVGEVRGEEAYDMIQAMNTGHEGSMSTIHANSPRDAVTRLENLLSSTMPNTPASNIRRQIVSAIKIIVQLGYTREGQRVITNITELVGMEGDVPTTQELFTLVEDTVNRPGSYIHKWNAIVPHHANLTERAKQEGVFPHVEGMMAPSIALI